MMNQLKSVLRCTLVRVGFTAMAVLLAALYVFAVSPTPGGAASNPHVSATCTQTAPFPYGSSVVGIAATSDDGGYWIATNGGYVAACGDAPYLGEQTTLNAPIVGIAATPDGGGFYLVASDGGIFTFGDAVFQGSSGSMHLNEPVVGMATTPDGAGYWLVAADGGIFSYGDAQFYGSTGGMHLNQPVVGMAAAHNGSGYWLVASDGGIFSYKVPFWGSTGSMRLNKPVVGMASDEGSGGYWLVASDGGVFAYSAPFYGSTGNIVLNKPIVGMETTTSGSGYRFIASDGGVFDYGTSGFYGTPVFAQPPTQEPAPLPVGGATPSCSISVSNDSPPDGYEEIATITSNQPNVAVTLSKAYKTVTSTDTGMTNAGGGATIDFNISGATPGYTVVVTAYVGAATCRTTFTPT
jgi:hypothetical protein